MVNTNVLGLGVLYLTKLYENMMAIPGIDTTSEKSNPCDIKLRIYHSCDSTKYEDFCVEDGLRLFSSVYYDKGKCNTILLTLPYFNNLTHYNVKPMIEALTSRCEFNIIALDNSIHTNVKVVIDYAVTVMRVYEDMKLYAKVLNAAIDAGLLSGRCLRAVGFSLGGQQAGQVCRMLKQKCCQILAIDPAGPLYVNSVLPQVKEGLPHLKLTSKSDAGQVVFVGCNSWFLGTGMRTAHDNIIVNGGTFQPTCLMLDVLCSHEFCNKLVIDAIRRPGTCLATESSSETNGLDLILPKKWSCGSYKDTDGRDLYLTSSQEAPVCIGEDGTFGGNPVFEYLKAYAGNLFGWDS